MDEMRQKLASLKGKELKAIRAELIVGLGEELRDASCRVPQTLALADALAQELGTRLYEPDDGAFDMASTVKSKEVLDNVRSRLEWNFSREKLAFACDIIRALKEAEPVPVSPPPVSDSNPTPVPASPGEQPSPVPEAPRQGGPSQSETSSAFPNAPAPDGWKQPTSKPKRRVGTWERRFAALGRRIDMLLEKLFG